MTRIVVLGAGIGGMSAAYELRAALPRGQATITLVGDGARFGFTPSNPWVAVGWRDRAALMRANRAERDNCSGRRLRNQDGPPVHRRGERIADRDLRDLRQHLR